MKPRRYPWWWSRHRRETGHGWKSLGYSTWCVICHIEEMFAEK